MMQTVPRWQVDVILSDGERRTLWISDNFIENVMRQVAAISFAPFPTYVEEVKIWLPSTPGKP